MKKIYKKMDKLWTRAHKDFALQGVAILGVAFAPDKEKQCMLTRSIFPNILDDYTAIQKREFLHGMDSFIEEDEVYDE